MKSLELSFKNDKLAKYREISKLYYENNRVLNSAFDGCKKDKINKIILQNQNGNFENQEEKMQQEDVQN